MVDLSASGPCDRCTGVVFQAGDVNSDGQIDGMDVQPFTEVLLNPAGSWPNPAWCAADMDGNRLINMQDVDDFVTMLLN
jgi:hypothetical protein